LTGENRVVQKEPRPSGSGASPISPVLDGGGAKSANAGRWEGAALTISATTLFAALLLSACTTSSPTTQPASSDDPPATTPSADAPLSSPGSARVDPVISDEPWTFGQTPGRLLTTPNFRIFTTVDDNIILDRTPRFVEFALAHYTEALGPIPKPTAKLETYILGTRPQWESLTRRIAGAAAPTYLRIQRGGFAREGRGVYWDIGPQNTFQIAAHEGWHQYTQATFRHHLPVWLEEGIACYMEGFRWHSEQRGVPIFRPWANAERFDTLRRVHARGDLVPLEDLLVSRPQELVNTSGDATVAYYAQTWALVHFLHESDSGRHAEALKALLQDAAEGTLYTNVAGRLGRDAARSALLKRRGDAVFRTYFDENVDAASERYRKFVDAIVGTGSRNAIVAGRSPLAASSTGG